MGKVYNAKGMEVTNPIFFINSDTVTPPPPPQSIIDYRTTKQQYYTRQQKPTIQEYYYPIDENYTKSSIVDFRPSPYFGFSVTRDVQSNIDFNLRVNPKRFVSTIGEALFAYNGIKKLFTGGVL